MSTTTIGGLTAGSAANLTGATKLETEDASGASVYHTAATLRTKMFAGGTGYTASDPLVVGPITLTFTSNPGFELKSDASSVNRALRFTNTQGGGKSIDISPQSVAGGGGILIYNHTDSDSLALFGPSLLTFYKNTVFGSDPGSTDPNRFGGVIRAGSGARSSGSGVACANNTFTTLLTPSPAGRWVIGWTVIGGGSAYAGVAEVIYDGSTNAYIVTSTVGANTACQMSGNNFQVKQTSGATTTVNFSALLIPF